MKREDLRRRVNRGTNTIPVHFHAPVSDADLAALGYVKLDVDVEALREALSNFYPLGIPSIPSWPNTEIEGYESWLIELGVQVLAALDGETT